MKYLFLNLSFFGLFCLGFLGAEAAEKGLSYTPNQRIQTAVAQVLDGDTFITTEGEHVRLLGLNTPEVAKERQPAEMGGPEAQMWATKALPVGTAVELQLGERVTDRYKRLLAHVYLADGTWVNGQLVAEGLAHVYSFKDNRSHLRELQQIENQARQAKKGLWQHSRWQVLAAEEPFPEATIGQFYLVEGVVKHVVTNRGTTYLNFGEDWRTDFTVEVKERDASRFKGYNLRSYLGKRVLVRGVLKPVNGVLVSATHPEQIELITGE